MRLPIIIIAGSIGGSTFAHAAWDIQKYTDPLTDKTYTSAELIPKSGPGKLDIHCVNGSPWPDLVFTGIIGFGKIDANYRFDDGTVIMRSTTIANDGRTVWLFLQWPPFNVQKMTKAKRLRVQLFPVARDPVFIDFDMTGAAEAISQVKCH